MAIVRKPNALSNSFVSLAHTKCRNVSASAHIAHSLNEHQSNRNNYINLCAAFDKFFFCLSLLYSFCLFIGCIWEYPCVFYVQMLTWKGKRERRKKEEQCAIKMAKNMYIHRIGFYSSEHCPGFRMCANVTSNHNRKTGRHITRKIQHFHMNSLFVAFFFLACDGSVTTTHTHHPASIVKTRFFLSFIASKYMHWLYISTFDVSIK